MQIQVIPRDCGGTEFIAQPHRLHLGAQSAEGIDTLAFRLPEAWEARMPKGAQREGVIAALLAAGRLQREEIAIDSA